MEIQRVCNEVHGVTSARHHHSIRYILLPIFAIWWRIEQAAASRLQGIGTTSEGIVAPCVGIADPTTISRPTQRPCLVAGAIHRRGTRWAKRSDLGRPAERRLADDGKYCRKASPDRFGAGSWVDRQPVARSMLRRAVSAVP